MKKYLTLDEVITIHDLGLKNYGGTSGIRDLNALSSALLRPQNGYYQDIIEEASALMESLLINHPFIDGNKRVAFATCYIFLEINGYQIKAQSDWLYEHILQWIANKENRLENITKDLRTCVIRK